MYSDRTWDTLAARTSHSKQPIVYVVTVDGRYPTTSSYNLDTLPSRNRLLRDRNKVVADIDLLLYATILQLHNPD